MATVQHNTLTAANLHEPKGIESAGPNQVYVSDGSGSGDWTTLTSVQGASPIGIILPFGGSQPPSGWLICNGQAISRVQYSSLFALLGTTFGSGNGTTTFNVPDLRGRAIAGLDNLGGTPANRITSAQADILGGAVGTETHTLTAAQVPVLTGTTNTEGNHTHTYSRRPTGGSGGSGGQLAPAQTANTGSAGAHSHTVTVNSGGGAAHNNMQPTMFVGMIIYTGIF